jgi:hypothetical protein
MTSNHSDERIASQLPVASRTTLDGRAMAIGVLSVTACVLFVGFLLVTMMPQPAYGIGQSDRGGDYIVLTQQLSSSQEGVVVIDAAAQRLHLYGFDFNRKELVLVSRVPLDRLRGVGLNAPADARQGP